MIPQLCARCGSQRPSRRGRYCSDACAQEARRETNRVWGRIYYREHRERLNAERNPRLRERYHADPDYRSKKLEAHRLQRRHHLEKARARQRKYNQRHNDKKRGGPPVCPTCGKPKPRIRGKRYCSPECSPRYQPPRQCRVCGASVPRRFTYCSKECHRLAPCERCGRIDRNAAGACKECYRRHRRESLERVKNEDPEQYKAINKAGWRRFAENWSRKHPEKARAIQRAKEKRREARERGAATAALTAAEWQATLAAFGGCCAYCGQPPELVHQEHVVPLAHGGGHVLGNVVPACPPCNRSKGTKDLRTWLADEDRYEAILMTLGDVEHELPAAERRG